jgi:hypothetical protein
MNPIYQIVYYALIAKTRYSFIIIDREFIALRIRSDEKKLLSPI